MFAVGGINSGRNDRIGAYNARRNTNRVTAGEQSGAQNDTRRESNSRALAVIDQKPREKRTHAAHARTEAAFVTQLLAHKLDMPQTRQKRRADPEQVLAFYAASKPRRSPLGERLDTLS